MTRSLLLLRLRIALLAVAAAAVVLAVAVLLPRYLEPSPILLVGVAVAAVAVTALFLVPVHALPAIALAVFALLPSRLLPQDGPFGALPVTSAVLVVWALRRFLASGRADPGPRTVPWMRVAATVSAVLFLIWSGIGLARSVDPQVSAGWLISFTCGALIPFAVLDARREAALVRRTWIALGGALGAYAVLEGLLRANPVWGAVYSLLGLSSDQRWSTYRAEASFGHPLFAALFFAVACALAVSRWLTTGSRWTLAAAIAAGLGLVFTVSRGALLGAGIALVIAYLASLLLRRERRWSRYALLAVLGAVGAAGLTQFDALNERAVSIEAQLSAGARDLALYVAFRAAEYADWIGSGPGTSGITARQFDDVVIENSALQLLISVGIPGLVLMTGVLGFAALTALARGSAGPAAGIVAYAICIAGFNAIDAIRSMHLLLGCLLIMALNTEPPQEDAPPRPAPVLASDRGRPLRAGVTSGAR